MRVSFEITLDDIHAFNAHYAQSSLLPRRSRRMVRAALTLTLVCLLFALGMAIRAPIAFWILGALILIGWWKIYPRRIEAITRQSTQRLYAEGKNAGMLGPHTVELGEEWLTESSSEREVRTRWRAAERVAVTDTHVFLYVTGFSAVIVPVRAFSSEAERAAFVALANQRLAH